MSGITGVIGMAPLPPLGGFVAWDPATVTAVILSGGNLTVTSTGTTSADQGAHVLVSSGKTSGKYYFEFTVILATGGINTAIGVGTTASTYTNMGNSATTGVMGYYGATKIIWSGGSSTGITMGGSGGAAHTYGIAVDLDNRSLWYKQLDAPAGDWNNSASNNPATNVGGVAIPVGTMVPFWTTGGSGGAVGSSGIANFGAVPFTGVVPSGFTQGWPI